MEFQKIDFVFGVFPLNVNYSASDWFWNDNLIVNFKLIDGTIRIIVGFFSNMFPNRENCRKLFFFSDSFLYIFLVTELVNKL
jgi:hypothetical protein